MGKLTILTCLQHVDPINFVINSYESGHNSDLGKRSEESGSEKSALSVKS